MLARLLVFLTLLLALTTMKAQDLHFSQFYHLPLQSNPAATGIFQGDWRVAGIYRNQWASVPVDYRTFAVAFDTKVVRRGNYSINGGLLLAHDQAGDAGLSWTQAGLTGNVARALNENQALTVGASVAFVQRAFDLGKLTFKNQWTGDIYDPAAASGENLAASSDFVPTLSAGLLWHYGPADTRTYLDAGLGIAHINRPVISFRDDAQANLPMRFNLLAQGALQLNERFDVVGFASVQQLSTSQEIVFGAGLRRELITGPVNATAVQFSLATRLADAIIPAIQLERNGWTVGLSYDINISGFKTVTQRRGGVEIAAVYRHLSVPPAKVLKSCPIF